MIRTCALVILLVTTWSSAAAQDFSHSCVVIQDLKADRPLLAKGDGCDEPLSPASTYKIPHALIALETGVATTASVETWDGRKYERQAEWNHDHTVISALRPSVLWVFQSVAARIGPERATEWLKRFSYGNGDASGPIDQYWINGRLLISAPQQVAFLARFFRSALPVQKRHLDAVREGLRQRPGTVENALGIHDLEGDWRGVTLFAKTGATTADHHRVSWLVGLLESGDRAHVFASTVWRTRGEVDPLDAARLAAATFVGAGLLPARR